MRKLVHERRKKMMENKKTNRACNHIRKARSGALKELILSFSNLTWRDKRNQGQDRL